MAAAEAIAASAAVDVAHEAAATAQRAVDVASAAAMRAAVKAAEVAAEAVLATAAAAVESPGTSAFRDGERTIGANPSTSMARSPGHADPRDAAEQSVADEARRNLLEAAVATAAAATAAATVAVSVAAVAEAAARAVVLAAGVIGEQLAKDVAATAHAVEVATAFAVTGEVSGGATASYGDGSTARPDAGAPTPSLSRSWVAPASLASPEVSTIVGLRGQGASPNTIAASLNADGSRTVRGRRWSAQSVTQVLAQVTTGDEAWPGGTTERAAGAASDGPVHGKAGAAQPGQATSWLQVEERFVEAERHLAEAQRLGQTGSWSWTVSSDQVSWSEEMYRLFGVEPATFEATYAGVLECVHPEDRAMVADAVGSVFTGSAAYEFDHRVVHPNGEVVWLHARGDAVRDEDGAPVRLYGTVVNRTEAELAERRDRQHSLDLTHVASHDGLTGLANRSLLQERLEHALVRHGRAVSVLVVNVDDFKAVNNIAGHASGDRLLIELASRLLSCAQGADTVARLSGDEFAVIMEQGDPLEVAQRMLTALTVPVSIGSRPTLPSVSVGIATSEGTTGADELLMQADVAMYAAKTSGKGRIATFDTAMGDALRRRTDLREALHDAVQRGEIVVHYQPIIDVTTQSMTRVEALVRWQRPDGLVAPVDFLLLAEHTGLIVNIGHDVLRQTCEQMCDWLDGESSRSVSVNVSPLQLAADDYADRVLATLQALGVQAEQVVLEVTETLFLDTTPGLLERLNELRARGIRISIDDFGTGYSSLGRLHNLPIDSIKIDRSFVDLILTSADAEPILTSIIAMAHTLGLDVTAEGVETAHQAALLIALGCDYLQGYHFARPQPAHDALTSGTEHALNAWLAIGSAPHSATLLINPTSAIESPR